MSTTNPVTRNRSGPIRSIRWAWIQAPPVHDRVEAVKTSPDTIAGSPRQPWIASGTYASAQKNANVRKPRRSTAVGIPRAARIVPGGVSRAKAGTATRTPATIRAIGAGPTFDSPATVIPAPITRTIARGRRRRASSATRCSSSASSGAGATARIAGRVRKTAIAISGRRPRKTSRQWRFSATIPAMLGPMTPGMTQAVERVANIRGRRRSGRARPIET